MTEEEAKTKWCPFARVEHAVMMHGVTVGYSFNRGEADQAPYGACISSACMAWRWRKPPYNNEPKGGDGYCGLAGKP